MASLRELFYRNPKNSIEGLNYKSKLSSVREKIRKGGINSLSKEETAIFYLTKITNNSTSDFEQAVLTQNITPTIIEINKMFFFDLTVENVTENELTMLQILARKKNPQFPDLFLSIFTELSPFFSDIPQFYSSLRKKLPDIFAHINGNRNLLHLFLFKSFRVLEDSENLKIVSAIMKKQPSATPCNDITFFLNMMLPQVRSEMMSREFLRFQQKYILEMNHISLPNNYNVNSLIKPPPDSFFTTLLPTSISDLLKINGGDLSSIIKEIDPNLRQSFVCDVIRWGINLWDITNPKERSIVVDTALKTCDVSVDIMDILISISLEYLTFSRTRSEDEKCVSTLIYLIAKFTNISSSVYLEFIESFATSYPIFADGIAKAQMRTRKRLKFKYLKLPEVEAEVANIDIVKELNVIQKKMKWNTKGNVDISGFIQALTPIFGKLKFYPPFDLSNEGQKIIEADLRVLKAIVAHLPVFFPYFVLNNPEKTEEGIELAKIVLESSPQMLIKSLQSLIPFVPQTVKIIAAISKKLENATDVSELIRVASHYCTIIEMQTMMEKPFFAPPGEATSALIKASSKWHRIAQTSFWHILTSAYDKNHREFIAEALIENATQMSPIGRKLCVQLMITSGPIKENTNFVKETISKTEIWKNECITILLRWGKSERTFLHSFKRDENACNEIAKYLPKDIALTDNEKKLFFK